MLSQRPSYLLCNLLFLVGPPALAGNLVASGQFDQPADIDGWTVTITAGEGSMSFEPSPDESDCYGSGSALLVTSSPGERDVEYSVCASNLVGGNDYAYGFEVFFPGGPTEGWLFWGVTWYDGPDCTGLDVSDAFMGPVGYAPEWQAVELWTTTYPEIASVRVELWVSSLTVAEPLHLNIDRLFVRPVAELFADGFELGESCRWTDSQNLN